MEEDGSKATAPSRIITPKDAHAPPSAPEQDLLIWTRSDGSELDLPLDPKSGGSLGVSWPPVALAKVTQLCAWWSLRLHQGQLCEGGGTRELKHTGLGRPQGS